jgi:hypothetical protein
MPQVVYRIQTAHVNRFDWAAELTQAVAEELRTIGMHRSVRVDVGPDELKNEPGVVAYLGSLEAASSADCESAARKALNNHHVVVPVVDSLVNYRELVPPALRPLNGWQWDGADAAARLARLLLRELGIEERQRTVFISYKRDDGLLAADQLYGHLSKHAFRPFMDRVDLRPAIDVQAAIADALEAYAFVLLVETPLAHTSDWIYDELDYALAHYMGVHLISWPGNPNPIPGSSGLKRQTLASNQLTRRNGYDTLTEQALEETTGFIEEAYASGLVRRRRNVLQSVEESARARGLNCLPLPNWRLLVDGKGKYDLVGVSVRLPEVEDLWRLDDARRRHLPIPTAVLVHAARVLRDDRLNLLEWAAGDRPLTLIPENAVGAYW